MIDLNNLIYNSNTTRKIDIDTNKIGYYYIIDLSSLYQPVHLTFIAYYVRFPCLFVCSWFTILLWCSVLEGCLLCFMLDGWC